MEVAFAPQDEVVVSFNLIILPSGGMSIKRHGNEVTNYFCINRNNYDSSLMAGYDNF
jgi:hypothetical protein